VFNLSNRVLGVVWNELTGDGGPGLDWAGDHFEHDDVFDYFNPYGHGLAVRTNLASLVAFGWKEPQLLPRLKGEYRRARELLRGTGGEATRFQAGEPGSFFVPADNSKAINREIEAVISELKKTNAETDPVRKKFLQACHILSCYEEALPVVEAARKKPTWTNLSAVLPFLRKTVVTVFTILAEEDKFIFTPMGERLAAVARASKLGRVTGTSAHDVVFNLAEKFFRVWVIFEGIPSDETDPVSYATEVAGSLDALDVYDRLKMFASLSLNKARFRKLSIALYQEYAHLHTSPGQHSPVALQQADDNTILSIIENGGASLKPDYTLEPGYILRWKGKDVNLTPIPFQLLSYLLSHPTAEEDAVVEAVWGVNADKSRNTLKSTLSQLRKRLLEEEIPISISWNGRFIKLTIDQQ
jgi:hypothetical protein